MQFVGAYLIFRDLRDVAVLICRQQFRRDGRVHHVHQHLTHLVVKQVLGCIGHKEFNQGLGYAGIQSVHRHLVAGIRAPSQRQFA